MAPRKATQATDVAPTTYPQLAIETPADIEVKKVVEPYARTQDHGSSQVRRFYGAVVAKTFRADMKQAKIGPGRTSSSSIPWRTVESLVIGKDSRTPEFQLATDAKPKPNPKMGAAGSLALVEQNADWSGNYYGHHGPIRPEYELLEPFTLLDVEVFVQQAMKRRLSLMFRNGYQIIGSNKNKVKYIERRINQISYMMKKTWANFMREILTSLSLCCNCFVLKIRSEEASGGVSSNRNGNKAPIAAYALVPPHSLFPYLDKGRIIKWRRYYNWGTKPFEDYQPEDVIHFIWDRKLSHIFGTPRSVAVRDDIFALRRLEENIELLFINHLFPLFHVKVGTEKAPAGNLPGGQSEIDHTRHLLQTMPKEGVFVTDERVEIDVVGAAKESLDPQPLLSHYKKRVFTGLGMSSIDMGEADTANSSTADSVSQSLKDSVKYDLDVFSDQISMEIFRDLFAEANFDISVQDSIADVKLVFQEIDMDNKVKAENHAINLYNNNGITHAELRKKTGHNPMTEEENEDTHHAREVVGLTREQATQNIRVAKATPKPGAKGGAGKKGRSGRKQATTKKAAPKKKVSQNASTPTNQHGTNNSPKKARSSRTPVSLFLNLNDALEAAQFSDDLHRWPELSSRVIDRYYSDRDHSQGSSYTKHHRKQIDQLKDSVGQITDLDELYDLTSYEIFEEPDAGGVENVQRESDESDSSEPSPEGSAGSGAE